jgi:hypothetical protein
VTELNGRHHSRSYYCRSYRPDLHPSVACSGRQGVHCKHGGIKTAGTAAKSSGRIASMISFHNLGSSLDRGVRNFVPVHGVTKTFVPNALEAWDHLEQLAYAFLIPISGQSKRWMKYTNFAQSHQAAKSSRQMRRPRFDLNQCLCRGVIAA